MRPIGITRRNLMAAGAVAAGGAILSGELALAKPRIETAAAPPDLPPGEPQRDYTPLITPNGICAPYSIVDGVKVFHLTAEEFDHEIAPGLMIRAWGYNGRTPGPTIEVCQGDRVRIYVTNKLPEPTTIHWHGILLPSGMDGVSGLSQPPIPPGETYKYEFALRQSGTHMYHSHFDEMVQIAMGMVGMFVIHPRQPRQRRPDRDFAIMLGEWRIDPGMRRPDPMAMSDFNVLTMNSRSFPGTEPLVARLGQRVRIRLGNLGPMDHHPIHLHGYRFDVIEKDGAPVEEGARESGNTVLVSVGATRAIEFEATTPGDWAFHCHMTHHTMNQMGHARPNLIGIDSHTLGERLGRLIPGSMLMGRSGMGDMTQMKMPLPSNSISMLGAEGPFAAIEMGGMFTIVKVREEIESYEDPGWYKNPAGTVAAPASAEELKRDGISAASQLPASAPRDLLYTCPMHPEVVSSKPGRCPKCNMSLIPKK